MQVKSAKVESFLRSFGFSVLLCLVWGSFSLFQAQALLHGFEFPEFVWLVYNGTISLLFLIRMRPSAVSMDPTHWVVALITCFSGFLFSREGVNFGSVLTTTAVSIIYSALFLGIVTALVLGTSYDFLPALRGVKTGYPYQLVRHPMYLSSMLIKLGYVLKEPSVYNALLLLLVVFLYDRRARYEEDIMSRSEMYLAYLARVKYRFIPGIY